MTLDELLEAVEVLPADASLFFVTDQGAIGLGYHVTEFKRASVRSIDCGGRQTEWTEASMQLMDGAFGKYMKVGKFAGILRKSLSGIDGLAADPLHVEFAHGNVGMRNYKLDAPVLDGDRVVVAMREMSAVCKLRTSPVAVGGCC